MKDVSAKHFSFVSYRDLRELVDTAAERYPNTEFFISSDKLLPHITGRQLRHCCCAFVHIVRSEGRQGEHIAVLGRNCAAWITAFFSIVTGGCVAVPLSVDAKGDELDYCVKKADCTTLVYERGSARGLCRCGGCRFHRPQRNGVREASEISLLNAHLRRR